MDVVWMAGMPYIFAALTEDSFAVYSALDVYG